MMPFLSPLCLAAAALGAPPPPPSPADLEFDVVQVGWIKDAARVRRFDDVLDGRDADLLRQLGCEHAACRRGAARDLESAGAGAIPALLWGRLAVDPEVRSRCESLLLRLSACRACSGSGRRYSPDVDQDVPCDGCMGLGNTLLLWRWGDAIRAMRPADLPRG